MRAQHIPSSVSGHLTLIERRKGPVFFAKIRRPVRLPDGRIVATQTHEKIGPAWAGKGRPAEGYFTKRTAEAALQARLVDLRRGAIESSTGGASFREGAEAWFTHGSSERAWKPSTKRDYRSCLDRHLLPHFGDRRLADIDTRMIEAWRSEGLASGRLPRRTATKLTAILHGVFQRARKTHGLAANPVDGVEPIRQTYNAADYDFYSVEEIYALARAAASPQDAALFLTGAFSGLRMGELLALRVRDVDFVAEAIRVFGSLDIVEGVGTPKSGKGRTVPMVPELAGQLAKLLQRPRFVGADDHVFVGETGGHLDGSALRRRYKDAQARAELRPLRFHDLRHTFGSLAIRELGVLDVQMIMGHADSRTTSRYTHYRSRTDEAQRLAAAFRTDGATTATVQEAADRLEQLDASDRRRP